MRRKEHHHSNNTHHLEHLIMSLATTVTDIQAKLVTLQASVDALTPGGAVDLTPVLDSVAAVQTTVNEIKTEVTIA
jgi:hypothetical protein